MPSTLATLSFPILVLPLALLHNKQIVIKCAKTFREKGESGVGGIMAVSYRVFLVSLLLAMPVLLLALLLLCCPASCPSCLLGSLWCCCCACHLSVCASGRGRCESHKREDGGLARSRKVVCAFNIKKYRIGQPIFEG